MGLGGFLKKWGPAIAGIAAIPFTGGTSTLLAKGSLLGKIGTIATAAGPLLGAASKSQAEGSRDDEALDLSRDRNDLTRFQINQGLPKQRMTDSMRASAISRMRPVRSTWAGPGSGLRPGGGFKINGGYNDDLVSPDTRRMADDITFKMMMDQMNGVQAPEGSQPRGGGAGNAILGGAALGTNILGAVMGRNNNPNGAGEPQVGGPITGNRRQMQIFDPIDIDDTEDY